MLEWLAALVFGGFASVVTMAVGGPLAAKLSRVHIWKRTAPRDTEQRRELIVTRNFEPLDFGPVTMLWPSESARFIPSFPVPPWPSENWTDPDFGRGKAAAQAATQRAREEREQEQRRNEERAARRQAQEEAASAQRRVREKREEARQQPQPVRQNARQQQAAREQQQREVLARQQQVAREQALRQQQEARKARPSPQERVQQATSRPDVQQAQQRLAQAQKRMNSAAAGMPSKAEVESMIQSLGLAGTVQHLMRENGWDFKTAAAWLAKARKS